MPKGYWRPKDLFDLYLMVGPRCPLVDETAAADGVTPLRGTRCLLARRAFSTHGTPATLITAVPAVNPVNPVNPVTLVTPSRPSRPLHPLRPLRPLQVESRELSADLLPAAVETAFTSRNYPLSRLVRIAACRFASGPSSKRNWARWRADLLDKLAKAPPIAGVLTVPEEPTEVVKAISGVVSEVSPTLDQHTPDLHRTYTGPKL